MMKVTYKFFVHILINIFKEMKKKKKEFLTPFLLTDVDYQLM